MQTTNTIPNTNIKTKTFTNTNMNTNAKTNTNTKATVCCCWLQNPHCQNHVAGSFTRHGVLCEPWRLATREEDRHTHPSPVLVWLGWNRWHRHANLRPDRVSTGDHGQVSSGDGQELHSLPFFYFPNFISEIPHPALSHSAALTNLTDCLVSRYCPCLSCQSCSYMQALFSSYLQSVAGYAVCPGEYRAQVEGQDCQGVLAGPGQQAGETGPRGNGPEETRDFWRGLDQLFLLSLRREEVWPQSWAHLIFWLFQGS